MKQIKYKVTGYEDVYDQNSGKFEQKACSVEVSIPMTDANLIKAQAEACNGEYTIEDDGVEEVSVPTQLDRLEAQLIYTAMMTDTLIEEE